MREDKFHDECGVVGVYCKSRETNCASYIYYGLYALQHRGQESAGISVNVMAGSQPIRISAWWQMSLGGMS